MKIEILFACSEISVLTAKLWVVNELSWIRNQATKWLVNWLAHWIWSWSVLLTLFVQLKIVWISCTLHFTMGSGFQNLRRMHSWYLIPHIWSDICISRDGSEASRIRWSGGIGSSQKHLPHNQLQSGLYKTQQTH